MPRPDFSKTGLILFIAGILCLAGYLAAVHFSGREAGRFLVWESKTGLSREAAAGWAGPEEGMRRSVSMVLDPEMNPLQIRLTFRRPEGSLEPETVYYKARLIHEKGRPVFESKGTVRFQRGQREVVRGFPAFGVPEPGEHIFYSQFKDSGGRTVDSEAVAALRRNVRPVEASVTAGILALTAAGAGFLIKGKKAKNGSSEV